MGGPKAVKTMRLRYDGVCAGCGTPLAASTWAHYLPPTKTVRCLDCGPTHTPPIEAPRPTEPPPQVRAKSSGDASPPGPTFVAWPAEPSTAPASSTSAETALSQGVLPRAACCGDCGRKLRRGAEALHDDALTEVLCLECVTLDTVHGQPIDRRTVTGLIATDVRLLRRLGAFERDRRHDRWPGAVTDGGMTSARAALADERS